MICPILSITGTENCRHEKCAWWTEDGCAINVLATSPLFHISVERTPEMTVEETPEACR